MIVIQSSFRYKQHTEPKGRCFPWGSSAQTCPCSWKQALTNSLPLSLDCQEGSPDMSTDCQGSTVLGCPSSIRVTLWVRSLLWFWCSPNCLLCIKAATLLSAPEAYLGDQRTHLRVIQLFNIFFYEYICISCVRLMLRACRGHQIPGTELSDMGPLQKQPVPFSIEPSPQPPFSISPFCSGSLPVL